MPQDYSTYRTYQAADFVLDLSFQRWAQGDGNPFWTRFPEEYPEKREAIQEALALIRQLEAQQRPLSSAYLDAQLDAVYATVDRRAYLRPSSTPWYRTPLFRYAASALVLLLVAVFYYRYLSTADELYETAYQETQTIRLDDGTEVILNTRSRLRVPPGIGTATTREVWLDGEAFFTVHPSVVSDRPRSFVVHTPQLEVKVLGTVFNVRSRSDGTQVLLQEGSVQVAHSETRDQLLMAPGEVVEVAATSKRIRKKFSEPGALAWRENAFDFREATLATVAQQIHDCYGKIVKFHDPAVAHYRFTARVSRDDLDLLLSLIENAFSVRTIVQPDTIVITQP